MNAVAAAAEEHAESETHQPQRESLLKKANPELLEKCRDIYERVKSKKEARSKINKEIAAIYSELEEEGLDKEAAKHVYKFLEKEEEQRRLYDLSIGVLRQAHGLPQQGDLFEDAQIEATRVELVK